MAGNTVSPYLLQLFDRVASTPGNEVLFVHRARRSVASFEHETATSRARALQEGRGWCVSSILGLLRLRPNVVVCLGHTSPLNLGAALACRIFFGAKLVYFGDTNAHQTISDYRKMARARLNLALKRLVIGSLFPVSLDLGATNRAAARLMRIRRGIWVPLYAVNFDGLAGAEVHEGIGAMERPRLVCVSRLVEQKNLEALLCAWARYLQRGGPGSLTIVGDGPLRARLETAVRDVSAARVRFAGAVGRENMGAVFAAADGLVLPSEKEPWGIVVTEALGLGLPVLATDAVGAARSLRTRAAGAIQICGTGEDALAQALGEFVSGLSARRTEAQAVSAWIRERYGMDAVAAQLVRTVSVERGDGT